MTPGPQPRPKHQVIADDLRGLIDSGELAPGDRLPAEKELAARYSVARETVRKALAVLQAEGLTTVRKGAGVRVREFQPIRRRGIERLSSHRWGSGAAIWDADIGGRSLVVDGLVVDEVPPPAYLVPILGDATVLRRRRRFVLDGRPVMLATSWLPAQLVAGSRITQPDTGPGGTFARLAELGAAPVHFKEELQARMPRREEVEMLGLEPATPVVVIYRTAFASGEQAVEVTQMTFDASVYIFEYEFDDPAGRKPTPASR